MPNDKEPNPQPGDKPGNPGNNKPGQQPGNPGNKPGR